LRNKNGSVICITLVYFILASIWLLGLYHSFLTTGDFGHYIQIFRNTVNGHGILTTDLRVRSGNPDGFYLWEHFALILFAFIPIYYIFPYPETLLLLKTFFISLSIIILWMLARKHLDEKLSLIIIISYVFNPFLLRALSFNFQEQIILPAIIFAQFYFYFNKNYKLFFFLTIMALFVSEYAALLVASSLIGLAITEYRSYRSSHTGKTININIRDLFKRDLFKRDLFKRDLFKRDLFKKPIILLLFISLISIIYYITVISIMRSNAEIGVVVGDPDKRVVITDYIVSLISDQSKLIDTLFSDIKDKILYINLGLIPVFYTALLSPVSIFPLILYIGSGWLVSNASIYEFGAHHPLYILPFMYIGYILVIKNLNLDNNQKKSIFKLALLVSILAFMFQAASFAEGGYYPSFDNHTKTLHQVLDMIPKDATILAQENIQPNLADRDKSFGGTPDRYYSYLNTKGFIDYHYIIFDRNSKKYNYRNYDRFKPILDRIIDTKEYGVWIYSDDIFVLGRGYNGSIIKLDTQKYEAIYTGKDLSLYEGSRSDQTLVHSRGLSGAVFWYGPYKFLPPGKYNLTLEIRRDGLYNSSNESILTLEVTRNRARDNMINRDIKFSDVETNWTNVSFTFQSNSVVDDVEFRGVKPSPKDNIYLRKITIAEE